MGFCLFAKSIRKNIGKNISKNISQKLLNRAKKSAADLKLLQKSNWKNNRSNWSFDWQ